MSQQLPVTDFMNMPDERGHFGPYGGRFVAETLMAPIAELEAAYRQYMKDPAFQRELDHDLAYFVGCTFMMMQSANATKPFGIKTLVALNSIMVDGTGMCGCCRVSVGGKTKFACVDGPEFDGHQVDWVELMKRQRMYLTEEKRAMERFHAKHCG